MKERISIKWCNLPLTRSAVREQLSIKGVVTIGFIEEFLGEWIIEVTDTSIHHSPQAHEKYLPACYKKYKEDVEVIACAYYNGMREGEYVVMWK